jgi:hypothetical protein
MSRRSTESVADVVRQEAGRLDIDVFSKYVLLEDGSLVRIRGSGSVERIDVDVEPVAPDGEVEPVDESIEPVGEADVEEVVQDDTYVGQERLRRLLVPWSGF